MTDAALLVIDVQESFRHATYWDEADLPPFVERLQALIDGSGARGIPVVQVFHTAEVGPFSTASGHVRTLDPVDIRPDAVFHKSKHSALVGTGLETWLTQRGIRRLIVSGIRTEQCCETTTRHASDRGWTVDFVSEATLTFAMTHPDGHRFRAAEIKTRTELVLAGRFARIATGAPGRAGAAGGVAAGTWGGGMCASSRCCRRAPSSSTSPDLWRCCASPAACRIRSSSRCATWRPGRARDVPSASTWAVPARCRNRSRTGRSLVPAASRGFSEVVGTGVCGLASHVC